MLQYKTRPRVSQLACQQGFAELVQNSHSPQLYQGYLANYLPPIGGVGSGTCQELNALGVVVAILPIFSDDSTQMLPGKGVYQVGVSVQREDGTVLDFACTHGICSPTSKNVSMKLSVDAAGAYVLVDQLGVTEHFSATGRLISRRWKDGYVQSLTYSNDGTMYVADSHHRKLEVKYGLLTGLVESANTPDDIVLSYGYDGSGRLTSVSNPSGTIIYQYNNASYPNALTGVVDENTIDGSPYVTWGYDNQGRANTNALAGASPQTSGVMSYQMVYNSDGSVLVTDPSGTQRTYMYQNGFGNPQLTAIIGPSCIDCGAGVVGSAQTYDPNGYLASSTDWNDNITGYTFDAVGELHQRVDGQGSAQQRTTTIDWDDTLHNPLDLSVQDASGATVAQSAWTYNARGEPLTLTRTDPATQATRIWTYTYCEQSDIDAGNCPLLGLRLSVDGPRTDVPDVTRYSYFPSDDGTCVDAPTSCPHRMGDLQTITDALGHTTTFLSYDGAGRPLSLRDANGVQTDLQYYPRGWLKQVAVRAVNGEVGAGDEVTGYRYDNVGNLTRITPPDGAYLNFTYDDAQRLTDITDALGNTVHYTLDNAGNRLREDTRDPAGTLKHAVVRQFNTLGQLAKTLNADGSTVNASYHYDPNGNRDVVTDGRGTVTNHRFDALNRLYHVEADPGAAPHVEANIDTTRDALDRITRVTDPQGLNTSYQYDGLGNLKQLTSPDSGTTSATFDAAGNVKTRTDARGVKARYTYDALGRVKTIAYPTPALKVTYTWDTTQTLCNAVTQGYSVGRLTAIKDGSGTTRFCYDRFGNVVKKQQIIHGASFITSYGYTRGNRLAHVTLPGGTAIAYTRDAAGRVVKVTSMLKGGAAQTVVSAVTYAPFGPVTSITYGDGRTLTRSFDADYVVSGIQDPAAGGLDLGFGRDAIGNLTRITSGSAGNQLVYDALNRLTHVNDLNSNPVWTYTYDATGNRLTAQSGTGPVSNYTYPTDSHHLRATGPAGAEVERGYDAAGNTKAIGSGQGFDYDDTGRMDQLLDGAGAVKMQYATNALGQRVEKYLTGNPAATQYAIRDEAGQVLGEYDGNRRRVREVVWMDGMPVGVLSGAAGSLSYLEPDQIGTPRVAIDAATGTQTWAWSPVNDAFGQTQPSGTLGLDLRMPGQVYDGESGVNYNYFRDYDAGTGRYVESDPFGLRGGLSTYAYVRGNPLSFVDSRGLYPGQPFGGATQQAAMDAAARDAAAFSRQIPDSDFFEFGGWIYPSGTQPNGVPYYTYNIMRGTPSKMPHDLEDYMDWIRVTWDKLATGCPGKPHVAGWHIHPWDRKHLGHDPQFDNPTNNRQNDFSTDPGGDSDWAKERNLPLYLGAPDLSNKVVYPDGSERVLP